ncbi:hypothetical protein Cob_v011809 [Colletotrichum orbiculare MAFF 240422]|uniref:Uncharacterized protein n=1 Tax=Colletotrichum orbiculare (strain 104-T / ATCC 96160 / CBS 514.97 / LARS 414 / MAFF 240422) TaxID=1213857 RepID=A0A484FCM3_COLOR|nr:hypothetical protein Cob_v011809 [Colletotrichum orbiculare MAFF 240422]
MQPEQNKLDRLRPLTTPIVLSSSSVSREWRTFDCVCILLSHITCCSYPQLIRARSIDHEPTWLDAIH